jgi:hypothetical protein
MLVSDKTLAGVKDATEFKAAKPLPVKGKTEPVATYVPARFFAVSQAAPASVKPSSSGPASGSRPPGSGKRKPEKGRKAKR